MKKLVKPVFNHTKAVYHMVVGVSKNAWFYPTGIDNPGDQILVTDDPNWEHCGEGFGGATLTLQLDTGGVFLLRGGWHSNGEAMLRDTGIDLTHKHLTHGCIMELDETVVHQDGGWVLGDFNRIENMAMEMVEKSGVPLLVEYQSMGGGGSYTVYPENKEEMGQ